MVKYSCESGFRFHSTNSVLACDEEIWFFPKKSNKSNLTTTFQDQLDPENICYNISLYKQWRENNKDDNRLKRNSAFWLIQLLAAPKSNVNQCIWLQIARWSRTWYTAVGCSKKQQILVCAFKSLSGCNCQVGNTKPITMEDSFD